MDDDVWKETVRDIYDDAIFRSSNSAFARQLVRMIEDRHPYYFLCPDKPPLKTPTRPDKAS